MRVHSHNTIPSAMYYFLICIATTGNYVTSSTWTEPIAKFLQCRDLFFQEVSFCFRQATVYNFFEVFTLICANIWVWFSTARTCPAPPLSLSIPSYGSNVNSNVINRHIIKAVCIAEILQSHYMEGQKGHHIWMIMYMLYAHRKKFATVMIIIILHVYIAVLVLWRVYAREMGSFANGKCHLFHSYGFALTVIIVIIGWNYHRRSCLFITKY